ncbi:pilin [Paraburkholderia silvatlantica]|uniref:Prepilin-type N-terminal cleavage/methylation domain-containing protein n=1 Tax=Paraburkholderia silvatlantica TaxID=321895 RepID=A0ABR6FM78_9BURK|nr:pilin [Paraburkholderia silvatlantica]MBB2928536.1 prepilin-type N-terminal cleavage/methylation domain-containing protein [Paraburkholderia silvatlantica]PVY23584.1 prepilin-type N-terminal cleavage/methylation domain-containing protein [Paraburkholderia silvatlantica]PXW30822.1 prepilin-type N-terminal cleavage/methylation domain-containing protein [Paraburkholderia silvatlantica]
MSVFFDNLVMRMSSFNQNDVVKLAERRATISDIAIEHLRDGDGYAPRDLHKTLSDSEKVKFLANTLAFRVSEFFGADVDKLSKQLAEDKPLALPEVKRQAIKTKMKLGFTLIEVMITVGIIGVVSAIAVPMYQSYTARSQVSEGITLADGAKPFVSEYHANNGSFPADLMGGIKVAGKWVEGTALGSNGQIVATFGSDAIKGLKGKKVMLTPKIETSGNLSWDCSSDAPKEYLPNTCNYAESGGSTQPSAPVKSWLSDDYSNVYSKAGSQYYRVPNVFWQYSAMYLPNGKDSTLSVTPGSIYKVNFVTPDGTLVFKTLGIAGQPQFLALKSDGTLMYQMPNSSTSYNVNKDGSYTAISQAPQWMTDYLASDDYKNMTK